MILTVDIGNSRIKLAQWQSGIIVARKALAHSGETMSDICDELFHDVEKPSEIFALCVAGLEKRAAFADWVMQHWQLPVRYMETAERYKDIINAYADPARHGVDRWAGLVAAHELFSEVPLCVIGAGTALTFDLLKADGEHLGGYIVPSYASMHQILLGATADIISQPTAHFGNEKIPDNTDDAVNSGLHILLQAGVREMCVSAKNALGEDMKLVITGGAAPTILAYPQMPEMSHQPDLVMQGLYRVMSQPESAVQNKAEI